MYLKSIEVHGFKSFANRIVFEFHNGITGIVGPNGSGKSNVADAVRWVLGEQRARQLRGGNMQDVIFSGTEVRRPLSYAMVSITLDNSDHKLAIDFDEVKVTRKLYRSGESEYMLNGSDCRLKDIQDLFYDTGIGKEGYSIIGQGQVERILNGKPEERRELFDEAAGIVKFKKRKTVSLKKLDNERANLLRVNDILSELEKQKGPLEKQSETAKEYLKKKENLKTYDINVFLLETERLNQISESLEKKIKTASDELEEITAKYENAKEEYHQIEDEMEDLDDEIKAAQKKLNETTLLKQQLEGNIKVLNEQIIQVQINDEHISERIGSIRSEVSDREGQLKDLETERAKMQSELNRKKQQVENADQELMRVQSLILELSNKAENQKNEIINILNSRASTKAKIQRYDTMMEQVRLQKSSLTKKTLVLNDNVEKNRINIQEAEQYFKKVCDRILEMNDQNSSLEEDICQIQKELALKSQRLQQTESEYNRSHSRLETLKNLTERYDGYGNSIRRVMEKRRDEKGILGVVADLIKVQQEYEVAVETALGGSIQNIVTDNEETAKRMIQYLKTNKFGRATFLPLTAISAGGGIRYPEAVKEKGVIGMADTLVHCEERYRDLVHSLLGRTLVVDHIDSGIRIAKKYHYSFRIVTTGGELINAGGSMTGGAFKNASNLLGRRREIEEMTKQLQEKADELAAIRQSVLSMKETRTEKYAQIDIIKSQLQEAYIEQNTAKINLSRLKDAENEYESERKKIARQNRELEQQTVDIQEQKDSIEIELETSENLEAGLTRSIDEVKVILEQAQTEEVQRQKIAEDLHLESASLLQKTDFYKENIQRINNEIHTLKEEEKELAGSKGDVSEEIQKKQAEIDNLKQTIEDSAEIFEELGILIEDSTRKKEELSKRHKTFLDDRDQMSHRMSDLDKECFRLNSRKEMCEENTTKLYDYMWEEYEITYSLAKELRNPAMTDLAEMKRTMQSIRSEIKALGPVNVNAIEDYKALMERYEFLSAQHADLLEAEESLVKIIDELDNAMRKQFAERFAAISSEFDVVFKQLFGGGKGRLELVEDMDILEAGIRIIAQPPGKKLQNMMQMSGGEKALTAIALLFAIQNLKPSPFCLLDEIEAALDDSNVGRFANYLHKLTKNTQFIVITHRRGTMASADRLYGITMQEKGVSTLVSVDLLEDELDN